MIIREFIQVEVVCDSCGKLMNVQGSCIADFSVVDRLTILGWRYVPGKEKDRTICQSCLVITDYVNSVTQATPENSTLDNSESVG